MAQMTDEEKAKRDISKGRNKIIEYPCGCTYLFGRQIILKRICHEHENHLITYYG